MVINRLNRADEGSRMPMDFKLMSSRLCRMSYEHSVSECMADKNASKVFIYTYDTMLAFIVVFEDTVYVVFRGMENRHELADFFKFWKRDVGGFKLHTGFFNRCEVMSEYIVDDLLKVTEGKRVIFTGHSYGGAMALALTYFFRPDIIVTFGAPKLGGGKNYANLFKGVATYRYHTRADFVTLLPPTFPMVMDFEHVGDVIYLDGIDHPYETHSMECYNKEMEIKYGYDEQRQ